MGTTFNNAKPFLDAESAELRMNFVHQSIATNGIALVIRKTPAKIRLEKDKLLNEWGFKLLLQVHDEVIGECPIENAKKCADRLSEIMINSAKEKISVPMKCDAEITKVWYGDVLEV